METWKDIEGYEGLYQVSDRGRVKSLPRKDGRGRPVKETYLKPAITNGRGCKKVVLSKNGKAKQFFVHRLVAWAFLGHSELTVNHIDENQANNCVENLEYMTVKENCNYGHRNEKIAKAHSNPKNSKPVGYTENGITVVFKSSEDAMRKLGKTSAAPIRLCASGKRHTAYGYHFFYVGGI